MNRVHYSSKQSEWGTPQRLFDELDREFHFTRDVCASRKNFKLTSFWDKADNALKQKWEGTLWMNPPYGRGIGTWLKKTNAAILPTVKNASPSGEALLPETEWASLSLESQHKLQTWFRLATERLQAILDSDEFDGDSEC